MKKKMLAMIFGLVLAIGFISVGNAATFDLADWAFYIDDSTHDPDDVDPMPVTGALEDGLGTLTWWTDALGTHNFISFFDYDLTNENDDPENTFYDEYGEVFGSAASEPYWKQSWEIDEPGWVFGDIYNNVLAGALDNENGVPIDAEDDVSFALGWEFTLAEKEEAWISLVLSYSKPTSEFYLAQTDPLSGSVLYFTSTLSILRDPAPAPVPEPATLLLLGTGLAGLVVANRRRVRRR